MTRYIEVHAPVGKPGIVAYANCCHLPWCVCTKRQQLDQCLNAVKYPFSILTGYEDATATHCQVVSPHRVRCDFLQYQLDGSGPAHRRGGQPQLVIRPQVISQVGYAAFQRRVACPNLGAFAQFKWLCIHQRGYRYRRGNDTIVLRLQCAVTAQQRQDNSQ